MSERTPKPSAGGRRPAAGPTRRRESGPRSAGRAERPPPARCAPTNSGSGADWLLARLLALLLLSGASGLLYHVATSDGFRIGGVVVAGNQLLTAGEVEVAAAVRGMNIFWVRQEEVRQRLQALPAVKSARVTAFLPNRLEIQIRERSPVAIWQAGATAFLVDEQGQVIGPAREPTGLTTIRDLEPGELQAGAPVDAEAVETASRLQSLLPATARTAPREFEYSRASGVSAVVDFGPRVRFGNGDNLDWKAHALVAVRRELERTGQRAELIDLRFGDRPYFR